MEKATLRFLILGGTLLVASMLQFLDIVMLGAAPNFVLVVIVIAGLFLLDLWHTFFLLSLATFLLKFSPSAEREIVAFFFVGLGLILTERKLPWHTMVNGVFLIVAATTMLYVIVDRASIATLMFVTELGYNGVLTYVLYHVFSSFRLFRHR